VDRLNRGFERGLSWKRALTPSASAARLRACCSPTRANYAAGVVWTMKVSRNGKFLATAGQDTVVRVWEIVHGRDERGLPPAGVPACEAASSSGAEPAAADGGGSGGSGAGVRGERPAPASSNGAAGGGEGARAGGAGAPAGAGAAEGGVGEGKAGHEGASAPADGTQVAHSQVPGSLLWAGAQAGAAAGAAAEALDMGWLHVRWSGGAAWYAMTCGVVLRVARCRRSGGARAADPY
jgi:hypothetical protein